MKNNIKSWLWASAIVGCIAGGMTSCKDYLDKEPASEVSADDAFKNFRNFQGYIEEIYNCIPDKMKCNWCPTWNWGDDEIMNTEGNAKMTSQVDLGNFRAWETTGNWLKNGSDPTSNSRFDHSLWPHAWYCIRKANVGLANLDKLTSATTEERQLIEGQLYFFRAWWHFELMEYFGGLPYIDEPLDASQQLNRPRLSYQECADKAAEDFRKAADLLPINWDNTAIGRETLGQNDYRINKIMALGYLGKDLLWAASPLMKNGAQTGGTHTYDYDTDYAEKAAEALGELLELVEDGQTQYALHSFDYEDIYNHTKTSGTSSYTEIFYTLNQNWMEPGGKECIFRGLGNNAVDASNWQSPGHVFGPKMANLIEGDKIIHQPTANYVENYGMANGLPIDDPDSGYDPTHPFKNRDPRFYHDIVFDGFKYINGSITDGNDQYRYCQLYTGGNMRDAEFGSRTGYFIQKLVPHTHNKYDATYAYGSGFQAYLPYMRLADIYLMYAEACAAWGGSQQKATSFSKTAEEALNTIRSRCGAGNVGAKYVASNNLFMDEVRRERAVELSFEGFRFNDLQRWLLLTEAPYTIKTAHDFYRKESDEFYEDNDPADAEVQDLHSTVILTRQFDKKHYWFPLPESEVYLYSEFTQNPGW